MLFIRQKCSASSITLHIKIIIHIQKRHLSGAHTLIDIDLAEHAFGFLRLRLLLFLHLFLLLLAFPSGIPLCRMVLTHGYKRRCQRSCTCLQLCNPRPAQQQNQCQYQQGDDNDPCSLVIKKKRT